MDNPTQVPQRIDEAISWYDSASSTNRWTFYILKIVQIGLAAAIPIAAAIATANIAKNFGAVCGSLIAALEAVQQLFQFQSLYVRYRSTCEAIRTQKALFQESAGDYTSVNARVLLVERIEAMMSQETNGWMAIKEQRNATKVE